MITPPSHTSRFGGLAWRLAAGFGAVTIVTLAVVLVVVDRLTGSAFGDYVGDVGIMRSMMSATDPAPDSAAFTESVRRSLLLVGVGGTALAAVAGFVLARRLTRPLRTIEDAAREIAAGDTAVRVPVTGEGELATLAEGFNVMAAALAASSDARKQFLVSVAHEFAHRSPSFGERSRRCRMV